MTWFVHHDEKILGPFTTEKIIKDLKEGELSYGAYIWSKGQVEWVPVSDWENNLEKLVADSISSDKAWKLRTPTEVISPLKFSEVVETLRALDDLQKIAVCHEGDEDWTPVFSCYSIMEALNMSRRNFLRAPLMGLAKITKDGSRFSYVVKTSTIGQGGVGVYGLGPNFNTGTEINLRIESEDLSSPITVVGTIVYNTDQGFVGIRFGELAAESLTVILDYIKRFQKQQESAKKAAA